MAVTVLDTPNASSFNAETNSRTLAHTVAAGTDTLLVLIMTRSFNATDPPAPWTVTYGGTAVTAAIDTFTGTTAAGRTCVWVGYLHAPTAGTANIVASTTATQRGLLLVAFNLDGNKTSGSPIGGSASQKGSATVATSVSLSFAAQATAADNLILAGFMISQNTALTSFDASGTWTDDYSGQFGNFPNGTVRHRAGVIGTVQAGATWSGSTTGNLGGVLLEVLAASVTFDDAIADTVNVTAPTDYSQPSSAKRTDLTFLNGRNTFTYLTVMQPDSATSDDSWLRIGAAATSASSFILRGRVNNGQGSANVWRYAYTLTDGTVTADTEAGQQTTDPSVLACVQEPGAGGRVYLNGRRQAGFATGTALSGGLVLSGTLEIGEHAGTSPGYATGLVARHVIDAAVWSDNKISLFSRAALDPTSVWGTGDEETAAEAAEFAKRSPVALPQRVATLGQPTLLVTPLVVDPDDSGWTLTSITPPAHGSAVVSGVRQISFTATAGYTGEDELSYTVAGAGKTSTSRIFITVGTPGILLVDDNVTVTQDSAGVSIDPLGNDTVARPARITVVSAPAHGTAAITADELHVNYVPAAGYTGSDGFTYTVQDAFGQTASASINVTVQPSGVAFVTCVDDSGLETPKGTALTLDRLLENDTASGPIQITAVTKPPHGSAAIQAGSTSVVYTPDSGYVGGDGFTYTARLVAGTASDSAAVSITVRDAPVATAGWGPGPRTGYTYWLGCRAGNWSKWSPSEQATALNRPNHPDVMDLWVPFDDPNIGMPDAADAAFAWISGADSTAQAGNFDHMGGIIKGWPRLWGTDLGRPCKLCLPLAPSSLSTKNTNDPDRWKLWLDFAAGTYNTHFRRLGRRLAIKDANSGRQVGTDPSHFEAGRSTPKAMVIMVVGWEINDSQRWSFFDLASTSSYRGFPAGTRTSSKVGDGLAQIITSIKLGYADHAGKECPYLFSTRPTARTQSSGGRYRDLLYNWPDASLCQVVGQSQHHNEQQCTANAPRATWYDVKNAQGQYTLEGLNSIGELATKHGWKVWLDETGQHFGGGWADEADGRDAALFWRAIHDWLIAHPSLCGGVSFYQGNHTSESGTAISSTSLIANPGPGRSMNWAGANKQFMGAGSLWKA